MKLSAAELQVPREDAQAAVVRAVGAALNLKEQELEATRPRLAYESQRYIALLQTDELWKQHMKEMNYVKDFAGLKVYAQQNPLQVYREEGLTLFESMQTSFRQNTV